MSSTILPPTWPRASLGKNAFRNPDGGVQVLPAGAPQPRPGTLLSITHVTETDLDEINAGNQAQAPAGPPQAPTPSNVLIFPTAGQQAQAQASVEVPDTLGPGQLNGYPYQPYVPGRGRNAQRVGNEVRVYPYGAPADQWPAYQPAQPWVDKMRKMYDWVQDQE